MICDAGNKKHRVSAIKPLFVQSGVSILIVSIKKGAL